MCIYAYVYIYIQQYTIQNTVCLNQVVTRILFQGLPEQTSSQNFFLCNVHPAMFIQKKRALFTGRPVRDVHLEDPGPNRTQT